LYGFDTKGRTLIKDAWEQSAEESIWTYDRGGGRRMEKIA
jgi:hypothetical protein